MEEVKQEYRDPEVIFQAVRDTRDTSYLFKVEDLLGEEGFSKAKLRLVFIEKPKKGPASVDRFYLGIPDLHLLEHYLARPLPEGFEHKWHRGSTIDGETEARILTLRRYERAAANGTDVRHQLRMERLPGEVTYITNGKNERVPGPVKPVSGAQPLSPAKNMAFFDEERVDFLASIREVLMAYRVTQKFKPALAAMKTEIMQEVGSMLSGARPAPAPAPAPGKPPAAPPATPQAQPRGQRPANPQGQQQRGQSQPPPAANGKSAKELEHQKLVLQSMVSSAENLARAKRITWSYEKLRQDYLPGVAPETYTLEHVQTLQGLLTQVIADLHAKAS